MVTSLNRKKLTVLTLGASLFAAFWLFLAASSASASTRELTIVADIASLHCKLWLGQIQGRNAPLSSQELSLLLKRPISPEEAESFKYRFKGLPDFSFIMQAAWSSASRADRQNFNFYFMQWLKSHYRLAGNDNKACTFTVSLTELPSDAKPRVGDPTKDRRNLRAIAQTILPSMNGPVRLAYELQQGRLGWEISEIFVNETGLRHTLSDNFIDLVQRGGYQILIKELINRSNQ